jgi:uncharacterized DUF497 family protein
MRCPGCDWDPRKDFENRRKHGISFDEACCVFEDPHRIEERDDREYDEDRWIVLGRVGSVVLVVVYAERSGKERIISARKAEPREEATYIEQCL